MLLSAISNRKSLNPKSFDFFFFIHLMDSKKTFGTSFCWRKTFVTIVNASINSFKVRNWRKNICFMTIIHIQILIKIMPLLNQEICQSEINLQLVKIHVIVSKHSDILPIDRSSNFRIYRFLCKYHKIFEMKLMLKKTYLWHGRSTCLLFIINQIL